MSAGWQPVAELLSGRDDAELERISTHLANGEVRPALVVRLDPVIVAVPQTTAPMLLLVDAPADYGLIRRHRLRVGSRLTAIVYNEVPMLGELFGTGPACVVDEATWTSLQQACDENVRTAGWMVRPANPLLGSQTPEPLDRMVAPRQVVVVAADEAPPKRRWRYLGLGIILVVLLKLLIIALRH
jgi:hypothetical protein